MTPAQFRAARHALGLSAKGLAHALRASSGRVIYAWERGEYPFDGVTITALEGILRRKGLDPTDFGITD
jgi:DNA-binding transcriptional regulator YiaG